MKNNNKDLFGLRLLVIALGIGFLIPSLGFARGGAKMGFLIWGKGDPLFVAPGKTGTFKDGNLVSLMHETRGFDFGKDTFTVEMKLKNKITSHTFKIDSFMGKSAYLVVDPSGTDVNPTFTGKFLAELCKLRSGKYPIDVTFKANNNVKNHGKLIFISDGRNAKFKSILAKFNNPQEARRKANEEFQRETAQKEQKEERERAERDYYRITIQNKNSGQTYYVITVDDRTRSEKIYEIPPRRSKVLELYRNQNYTIKGYSQNQSKYNARTLANVNNSWNRKTITVR